MTAYAHLWHNLVGQQKAGHFSNLCWNVKYWLKFADRERWPSFRSREGKSHIQKKTTTPKPKPKKPGKTSAKICYFWIVLIKAFFTLFLSYHLIFKINMKSEDEEMPIFGQSTISSRGVFMLQQMDIDPGIYLLAHEKEMNLWWPRRSHTAFRFGPEFNPECEARLPRAQQSSAVSNFSQERGHLLVFL